MNITSDKKEWLARYCETFEKLEHLRLRALRNMTEEEAWQKIASLKAAETPWRARRDWSGLVEQQAYFAKWRKS